MLPEVTVLGHEVQLNLFCNWNQFKCKLCASQKEIFLNTFGMNCFVEIAKNSKLFLTKVEHMYL